jgi:hypothetical protein
MDREEKAKYYNWLQKEYQLVENEIMRVPKLTVEEQSKNVNMVEYSPENQQKVNALQQKLNKIATETEGLF